MTNKDNAWLITEKFFDTATRHPERELVFDPRFGRFTYRDISMGFNMDADVVTANQYGSTGVHTNNDDFMEYYDCNNPEISPEGCAIVNNDTLRVSMSMIYDYDFYAGALDVEETTEEKSEVTSDEDNDLPF